MGLRRSRSLPLELNELGREADVNVEPERPSTFEYLLSWLKMDKATIATIRSRLQLINQKGLRKTYGLSGISIFRSIVMVLFLNLIFVTVYDGIKSSFRETRLRRLLGTGGSDRTWVFSHNDEMHGTEALTLALGLGAGAIEADVWLGPTIPLYSGQTEWDLFVGHRQADTAAQRSLKQVYLDPLLEKLSSLNDTWAPETLLLIDFKHQGEAMFSHLESALQPLLAQNLLTTYDPKTATWHKSRLRVVGTGETPLSRVIHQSPRYIFYDAPLTRLSEPHTVPATSYSPETIIEFTPEISPIASDRLPISYHLGIFFPKWRPLNPFIELLQAYSNEARRRGIEPRWWGFLTEPRFIRKKMWRLLKAGGSNWICADDVLGATRWLQKWDRKQARMAQMAKDLAETV
ncbi:hypothetical protein BD324DRAFT_622969 [Kockovaella imperatae]|uniref:Altered inheritance of mitochondria protein 6 n=1 Tax=Kockovaella imperatae TaxID=4999 RepID=A0A1Y1UI28_9TREE|nr:hypothetical protein BD324DRAFT_622969 [Kockovaella imperatae]ORX37710.1 hypothetical protein BD324DRAFT_622969 [Kockovaella imperatae]